MRQEEYLTLIDKLCKSRLLRRYRQLVDSLAHLDMSQRSSLAKLCRAQCYPTSTTRLAKLTNNLDRKFVRDILPLLQTPLLAGLVLQLVLMAPMSRREIVNTYTSSMLKEQRVLTSIKRECTLRFDAFFGDYTIPVSNIIPVNVQSAKLVHGCVERWIRSLENRVLYPRVGSKTVSKMTRDELYRCHPDYEQNSSIGITPIDLERVYYETRLKVAGPCEMRQKWYTSNLQPRTYYAQGGSAYHSSKYLADPLTELCDTLPSTNRRTRVDPSRLLIREPHYDIAYYDLTSFTSNLHVHCEFMYRLAKYCSGTMVQILDSVEGIMDVDLGGLIYDYTRTNLQHPEYTIPSKYGDPSVVHYHSVAGFLGVYGNIASATFIHGIVMAMLHMYTDESNVAGDDGLDITQNVDHTLRVVSSLGIVQDEKTFRQSEGCCIHLKRPICRIGRRLHHGQLIAWPSLEAMYDNIDERYPYILRLSRREKMSNAAGSITAFLRKIANQSLEPRELDLIDIYLTNMYDTYGLPKHGCVPQVTPSRLGFVPVYERRFIGMDPIENTLSRLYANIATLPLRGKVEWDVTMLEQSAFECNSNKLLKHLVVLGCIRQVSLTCCVFGNEGLQLLLKEYTNPDPPIYQYVAIHTMPVWITDFIVSNSK